MIPGVFFNPQRDMLLRPVWILAALNLLTVTCIQIGDLACSGGSEEIEIDGYDPRGFRFPPKGSNGFPVSTTCVWKFNTEADLRIVLGVTDITKDATDTITLRDSNGDILPTTSVAVGTREGFKIVTSTGNSLSIQLDTDDSSNDEEIYIYIISGVDSGTCPGNSKISATDEYQIITSSNFPDDYNDNEVCTVSITADENKVISYEILFKQIKDSTTFAECEEIFEVFDGSTLENRIFDTCNSFLPGRLSKLKTTSVGRTLDLRFVSTGGTERSGFVLLFKQEDFNECLEKNCSPRDICFEPESLNEFECNGHAETTEKRFLSCPNDGSEVVIDVPEFEAQTFSFPPPETDGFPISSTCTWTFKGEEGSGIIINVFNMTFEGSDSLSVDNDAVSFGTRSTFEGPLTEASGSQNRISIDSSMKVILTTDNNFNKMERFTVSVISGRDSGTCPGSKTIQATDSFQTITSANFPEAYGLDGDCDVTITADEGMVIVFSFPCLIIDEYRDFCFDYLTLSTEKETYYTCLPFRNAINSQTTGNNLRIKFKSNDRGDLEKEFGFAVTFKQKASEECKQNVTGTESGVCDINAVCINTDGSFECECKDGFTGSGFACIASTTMSRKKILLPLYLVWSLGTTVNGAMLLILLYKMAAARNSDIW